MPFFPKVQSPCPYKSQLSAVMDGDFCRMCERQVFDLTTFSDGERRAFLSGCAEEVCVSYRLPMRAAVAAAALAGSMSALPAAAQPSAPPIEVTQAIVDGDVESEFSEMLIIVGGIKDPATAEMIEVPEDPAIAELPILYEDDEATAIAPDDAAPPASPAR